MSKALRFRHTVACLIVCGALGVPVAARGQSEANSGRDAAQALFDKAIAEMDAKHYASACTKLEEVTQILPKAIGAKLTLAECYEVSGKLASAWSQYVHVEMMAATVGDKARADAAGQSAAGLKPKLATLTLEVPTEVRALPKLAIIRNGAPIPEPQWGMALPVDVGEYEIIASAPGRKAWIGLANVTKDGEKVTLKVTPLAMDSRAEALEMPTARPNRDATQKKTSINTRTDQDPWPLIGATAIVATIGLGMGIGFTIASNDKINDIKGLGQSLGGWSVCVAPDKNLLSDCNKLVAQTHDLNRLSTAAVWSFVAGGVGALGTVGFAVAKWPRTARRPTLVTLGVPLIGATHGGLAVAGIW